MNDYERYSVLVSVNRPKVYHRYSPYISSCLPKDQLPKWSKARASEKKSVSPWVAESMGLGQCKQCWPYDLNTLKKWWLQAGGPVMDYPEDM